MVKRKYIGIRLAVLLIVMLTGIRSWSQTATYYHHYDWLQQFLVKETGAGVLTPDWYYSLVYPNYKKTAYIYNKTGFRVSFGANKQQQIGMSVKIDSVMTQRAKEEAWNMTDRISATTGTDLAWNTEKDKIEEQLRILQAQTNNIIPSGGTFEEKDEYIAIYNSINCAINAVRGSYQPTSKRKEAYLGIYKDLCQYNLELSSYILKCKSLSNIKTLRNGTGKIRKPRVGSIVQESMERWQNVLHATSQSN